ncbi:MAG TPA: immune inhibitor A, partial [Candidatus Thalassarchaeaceae archaeon]|nr:immune inhibitor A [Candidatus Thalassarchaeaceae archaeon]
MSTWRTVVVTTLLLSAIMVHFYPNSIDDWAEKSTPPPSQEDYPYTSIQTSEKWLVLPVSFPNNPISPSNVADMFAGAGCSMCSAEDYINVMTDGQTELEIEIQEVWNAPNGVRQWGEDVGGERDYGSDGKGVESLLSSVVSEVLSGENLAPWDLNNDGVLDRVLLIHSAPPQESSGNSNSLWSHFSLLDDPLTVGEWEIEHYVVASTDSGLGTVIHEILHSMGALDLYDVHDELPTSNWNGIGDWGIMASGNWNGDGETPSMPSASSMNLIGLSRFID